jgi:hypothetical protein
MNRLEHLEFCKFCLNRAFSPQKGIICKLTDDIADFKYTCKQYKKDSIAILQEQNYREEARLRSYPKDFTFGLEKYGLRNGIITGVLLLIFGFTWLLTGLNYNLIYWYPFILIIGGTITLLHGIINSVIRKKLDKAHKNKK